jgi:transposase
MTYGKSRFYAFGVANGKREHFYFYSNKKKKTKNNKKKSRNIDGPMTLNFLKRIHHQHQKILLIWDKAPNHKARIVQEYIQNHHIKQIWLPTACPELNPIEPAWNTLKTTTANTHYPTITDYKKAVKKQANKKNLTKMFKYISH